MEKENHVVHTYKVYELLPSSYVGISFQGVLKEISRKE